MESERHDGLSARPRIFIPCRRYKYSCKKTESAIEKDSKILTHLEAEQRTFKRYTEVTAQAPFSAFQPSVQIGDIVLPALRLIWRAEEVFAPQEMSALRKIYCRPQSSQTGRNTVCSANSVVSSKKISCRFKCSFRRETTFLHQSRFIEHADCAQNTVFERNSNFPVLKLRRQAAVPFCHSNSFFTVRSSIFIGLSSSN